MHASSEREISSQRSSSPAWYPQVEFQVTDGFTCDRKFYVIKFQTAEDLRDVLLYRSWATENSLRAVYMESQSSDKHEGNAAKHVRRDHVRCLSASDADMLCHSSAVDAMLSKASL
ncbi:uncharacterized protein LOC129308682 [Prosopis cineraria]|uniref:uncharacterized protein LOC129308682 n=1 Tax=Prosopis cineraria TaxID=364024 RepID=UPI0024106B30|nr:uncharacterized protein LOC129308682 [Prosopis cineraria]